VWLAAAVALTVGVRQLPATDVRARGPLVGSGSDIESCKMCPGLNLKCESKKFCDFGATCRLRWRQGPRQSRAVPVAATREAKWGASFGSTSLRGDGASEARICHRLAHRNVARVCAPVICAASPHGHHDRDKQQQNTSAWCTSRRFPAWERREERRRKRPTRKVRNANGVNNWCSRGWSECYPVDSQNGLLLLTSQPSAVVALRFSCTWRFDRHSTISAACAWRQRPFLAAATRGTSW
jgi:hypothetical protein